MPILPPEDRQRAASRVRFVFTAPADEGIATALENLGAHVSENRQLQGAALIEAARSADVLVTKSCQRVGPELFEAAGSLRAVVQASAGLDNIDVEAARRASVEIILVDPGNATAAAELTLLSILALLRDVPGHWLRTAAGTWCDREALQDCEARGKRLGLVGLGRIGSRVSMRALAFEMSVTAYDPYLDPARFDSLGVERADKLAGMLSRIDILSIHCPLTAETRGMIDAAELERLPRGALLVNTARGGIVGEVALCEALDRGHLRGAAVDVHSVEPVVRGGLAEHPRVLATPHVAGHTMESHAARRDNLHGALVKLAQRLAAEVR